jgi:hypothetical protein
MNTFRTATRRIHARRYAASLDRREPIRARRHLAGVEARLFVAAAIVCAAIFAGSFAVGRVGRTASSAREAGPLAGPVGSVGSPIPTRLSSAPTIQIEAPAPPPPKAAHQPATHTPVEEGRAIVAPAPPTSPTPPAAASPEPAAQAPPANPPQPSTPSAAPPASSQRSSAGSSSGAAPASETGKSFDTSG